MTLGMTYVPILTHTKWFEYSVRSEYYIAMNKLKSELHMSEKQAQGAICTVANILFGRKDYGNGNASCRANQLIAILFLHLPTPIALKLKWKH